MKRNPFIRAQKESPEVEEYNNRLSILDKIQTTTGTPYSRAGGTNSVTELHHVLYPGQKEGFFTNQENTSVFMFRGDLFTPEEIAYMQQDSTEDIIIVHPGMNYYFFDLIEGTMDLGYIVPDHMWVIYSYSENPTRGVIGSTKQLGNKTTWEQAQKMALTDPGIKVINPVTPSQLETLYNRSDLIETHYSIESPNGEPVLDENGRVVNIRDSIFMGLVYAGKNFFLNSANYGFKLTGGLVAYDGNIQITAKDCGFTYDTRYLSVFNTQGGIKIYTLYWVER
jgi:hypothetical protein